MKRIILNLLPICFLCFNSYTQDCNEIWAGTVGDSDIDLYIDADGNSYAFENNINFHNYFTKYSPSGEVLFVKEFKLSGGYFLQDVVGDDQHVYVISSYNQRVEGSDTINADFTNGLVMKFDLGGNLVWERIFEGGMGDQVRPTSGAVDAKGNLYVGAFMQADTVIVDGQTFSRESSESWFGFYKFDANGNLLWVRESQGSARVNDMEVTENGNIASVLWLLSDRLAIGGEALDGVSNHAGVMKMNSSGEVYYLYGTSFRANSYDITSIAEDVFFTGPETEGNDDGGYIGKLNFKGDLEWMTFYKSENEDFEGWGAVENVGNDVVRVLTPVNGNMSDGEELSEGLQTLLIDYDANTGDKTSSIEIDGLPADYASTFRGAQIVGDKLFIPHFGFNPPFDPTTDDISLKAKSLLYVDVSQVQAGVYPMSLSWTTSGISYGGSFPQGTTITLTAEGNMTGVQWYRDGHAMTGETNSTLDIQDSNSYRFEGIFASGCTNTSRTFIFSFFESSLANDSLVLVDFYNQTGGNSWTNNTGWLKDPIANWYGVTLENGRVSKIILENNFLISNTSLTVSRLTELTHLDVSDNLLNDVSDPFNNYSISIDVDQSKLDTVDLSNTGISSIPQLGENASMVYYDVRGNESISLSSLERNVSIPTFLYNEETFASDDGCNTIVEGEETTLFAPFGGDNGAYSWTKDGADLGVNEQILNIGSFGASDAGIYEVTVTNSQVPNRTSTVTWEYKLFQEPSPIPTGTFTAMGFSVFDGTEYESTATIDIVDLGNGEYSISDVSGGFYALFGFSDPQEYAFTVNSCGVVVTHSLNSNFGIENRAGGSWNETDLLEIAWRDNANNIDGLTSIDFTGVTIKQPQQVTITTDPTGIEIGDVIVLNATTTSGLSVNYSLTDGQEFGSLSGNEFTSIASGWVTVKATQDGDDQFISASDEITFFINRESLTFDYSSPQEATYTGSPIEFDLGGPIAGSLLVTYSGSSTVPSNSATYEVEISVISNDLKGYGIGTLIINQAEAKIAMTDSIQTYDGEAKTPTITTDPEGLSTIVTYNGSESEPIDVGVYDIFVEVDEINYFGTYTGQFTIEKVLGIGRDEKINIYPNPVINELSIDFNANEKLTVLIYSQNGRLIKSVDLQSETRLNVSDLGPGIYMIEISSDKNSKLFSGKLIKK